MTEQEKRERAIDVLEFLIAAYAWNSVETEDLGYALELLKAQGPRVISFDEIDNYEVVWLEVREVETEDGLAPWVKTTSGRWFSPLLCGETQPDMILSTPDEYGKICRCWTSRPDEKRRVETPWES